MGYPCRRRCSRCTTEVVVDDASLEAFVACPSCGACPCATCSRWLDAGELLIHSARCAGDATATAPADDACRADPREDDDCWTFWERPAPADEEIEVEWEWDQGDVRWSPCTVLEAESSRGARVEYLEDEGEDKEFIHGLRLDELSVDERLDVLAECDEALAETVPWIRCAWSGEVLADLVGDQPRRWRYRYGEEDNQPVAYRDLAAAQAVARGAWLRNAHVAAGPRKRRKTSAQTATLALSVIAGPAEALEAHFAAMREFLDHVDLPRSERRNVLRKSCVRPPRAANVGVTMLFHPRKCVLSQSLRRHDALLAQALTAFFRRASPKDLPFTSVQINRCDENDQTAACHRDRHNLGPSLICGLGDYSRGQLWTADRGVLDCRHNFVAFDGRVPHAALPFAGSRRYTLVFWCCAHADQLPPSQQRLAERLGFCFPSLADLPPPTPRSLSLTQARDLFREACAKLPHVPTGWADD